MDLVHAYWRSDKRDISVLLVYYFMGIVVNMYLTVSGPTTARLLLL